ncbi:MAG: Holliday junction resolvase RuvX [Solirubrobacterales bacterium]
MRILALDHGSARCGCAVSDPTGTLVRPLSAIVKPDTQPGLEQIQDLIEELSPRLVLVGLPILESGEEGSQAAAARSFVGRLAARAEVPVELYDERFTTRQARESQSYGAGADRDSLAAAHLLEAYLHAASASEEPS